MAKKSDPTPKQLDMLQMLVDKGHITSGEKTRCGYKKKRVWGDLNRLEAIGLISCGLDRRDGVFGDGKRKSPLKDNDDYFITTDAKEEHSPSLQADTRSRTGSLVGVARFNRGLTQRGLTVALGLTELNRTTVAHIEQGLSLPSNARMHGLSLLLNIPLDTLCLRRAEDKNDKFLQMKRDRAFSIPRKERAKMKKNGEDPDARKWAAEEAAYLRIHGFKSADTLV